MVAPELTAYEIRLFREEDRGAFHAAAEPGPKRTEADAGHHVLPMTATREGVPFAFGFAIESFELSLLADPRKASPAERWNAIRSMLAIAQDLAVDRGVREMHIYLEPELERYARRLETLPGITRAKTIHLVVAVPEGDEGN